jgi:competence protein ComFB
MLRYVAASGREYETETLEDVACVALNHLPARYVRHSVDIAFYLTGEEREKVFHDVKQAVEAAFAFVADNPR